MTLQGKTIICLLDDEFEDLELWYPVYRVREEGATVLFAGPEKGRTHIGKYGVPATADLAYDELDSAAIDGLLVPGLGAGQNPPLPESAANREGNGRGRKTDRTNLPCRLGIDIRQDSSRTQGHVHARYPR